VKRTLEVLLQHPKAGVPDQLDRIPKQVVLRAVAYRSKLSRNEWTAYANPVSVVLRQESQIEIPIGNACSLPVQGEAVLYVSLKNPNMGAGVRHCKAEPGDAIRLELECQ
jgi:hypothetical protein